MRNTGTIAFGLLLSVGTPLNAQTPAASVPIIEGAEPAIWSGDAITGPITHRATGAVFPEDFGGLKRIRVSAVRDDSNVAVNYRLDRTTFTVVVHRRREMPELALPFSIVSLGLTSPQAVLWSDGPFDVEATPRLRLFKGSYRSGIGRDTAMDYLYFGSLGEWTVKVRASLPSPKNVSEERRIDAAVRGLPWVALIMASGGCTGPACRADRVAQFNDSNAESMMAAGIVKDELLPQPTAALFTRAEKKRNYWVAPLHNRFRPMFTDGYGAMSVAEPLYALSMTTDKAAARVLRFFSGTPDRALFDRTVDQLERKPEKTEFLTAAQSAVYVSE